MIDTFAIGSIRVGKFILTVSHNPFLLFDKRIKLNDFTFSHHDFSGQFNLEYYDISLAETRQYGEHEIPFYINLVDHLASHDSYFNFPRPTKGLQDEKEVQSWTSNKSMNLQMPMWHLRKSTVQRLTKLLNRLAEEKITLLRL